MVRLALPLGLLAALLAAPARADIPPDPNSPNAHCTPAEQCPSGVQCPDAFHPGQPESEWKPVGEQCRADAEAKGLQHRCRDGGNYGGEALYCPPGETGTWKDPNRPAPTPSPSPAPTPSPDPAPAPANPTLPTKAGMCSLDADAGASLALVGLLLWRRRRR